MIYRIHCVSFTGKVDLVCMLASLLLEDLEESKKLALELFVLLHFDVFAIQPNFFA